MRDPAPNHTPSETFWLIVFPCLLAAAVIALVYLIAVTSN